MLKPKELALHIAEILDSKKGEDIAVLDVNHLTSVTDFFVIAGARSTLQARAMAEEVEDKLSEEGLEARRRDGYGDSRWIVLDYASVIVHVFHHEEREVYNIERLWMDGSNRVPFEVKD
ncbi:MAG: ribosome silencing factor [Eubacteriales bacterium]|nr:ribosome silencing factor [Eubacteriales bacterium]